MISNASRYTYRFRKYRYPKPIGAMKMANTQQSAIVIALTNNITNALPKSIVAHDVANNAFIDKS